MAFVHLHTHSNYSLLDGLSKLDQMIAKAKKLGMTAIALTDHGNLYGSIDFYKKCKAAGIKPIIGVEAYIAARGRLDKEPNVDSRRCHLTLIARNNTGYQNLLRLVSLSNLEGYYYKPRMDKEILRKHSEGLICFSGCFGSELSRALRARDEARALAIIKEHQEIFGKENYYLEIMHHPKIEGLMEVKAKIIELGQRLNIPLVATQDSHYLEPEDAKAHDTLVAIQTNTDAESKRFSSIAEDYSFIDEATARQYFTDAPEAVDNTGLVAERCNVELTLGQWVFPTFPLPEGVTPDEALTKLAQEKLADYLFKNQKRNEGATKRLEYELSVIIKKGYSPYFLVVSDIITFARANNIFTNTRGSAAGSFASFLIGITNIDPLVYELPFERFLNPDRPSPPDIDMDFADKRRDEVLDYVRGKYGLDHVAQIGTFGSMMARAAVRDVARALGHPYGVGDRLSKLIPLGAQGFPMTIDRAMKETPELKEIYEKEADSKEIIDLAKKIEGGSRHISVHAAGVVIAPSALTDFVPLQNDPRGGKIITQYDMHAVEDAGLLKFDFLGIRNLSILEDAVRLVEKINGQKIDIDNIPLDDKKTFEMLARGETMGLFQLNGSGMTRWLKELQPSTIHDINAMVALYRPGPMEMIPEYIKRKHNPKLVKYLDPRLKNILNKSYGVITYQDDVMLIAIHLAGYSWVEADKLRKAMGKKIPKEMAEQKEKLLKGFVAGGLDRKKANELWGLIEPFAAYGFNKAHAASYGRVAYQTSYMKANFPTEYMTAVLSAESGDNETVAEVINECQRMQLPVLAPHVNESFGNFTALKNNTGPAFAKASAGEDKIRFGLYTIKNLGTDIADAIVAERKQSGPYLTLATFLERVTHKNLNKKSLESLIKAGALDGLGYDRATMLANMEDLLEHNKASGQSLNNQASLFGAMSDQTTVPQLKLIPAKPITMKEQLAWEKDLLGLYLSGHPLEKFREKINLAPFNLKKAKLAKDGAPVVIAVIIEEVKMITTKSGSRMAFVRVADFDDRLETVVFTSVYDTHKELIEVDKCVALRARVSHRNGEPSLIVDGLKELV